MKHEETKVLKGIPYQQLIQAGAEIVRMLSNAVVCAANPFTRNPSHYPLCS